MPVIKSVHHGDFLQAINELLHGCATLLDVGAGLGHSLAAMKAPVKIGLEIHRPYLENWPRMESFTIPLNLPARSLSTAFMPKTIDAVSFIDSLEHLTTKEARHALANAEQIACKVVLIFTPRGYFPQQDYDAWGLGGEVHQRHRSAWEPEDLSGLGYEVIVFVAFHNEMNEAFCRAFGPGAPPVDAMLAYKKLEGVLDDSARTARRGSAQPASSAPAPAGRVHTPSAPWEAAPSSR